MVRTVQGVLGLLSIMALFFVDLSESDMVMLMLVVFWVV